MCKSERANSIKIDLYITLKKTEKKIHFLPKLFIYYIGFEM